MYYVLLKALGAGGWPSWLPYRVKAPNADKAIEIARKMVAAHYTEFSEFEVQAAGRIGEHE